MTPGHAAPRAAGGHVVPFRLGDRRYDPPFAANVPRWLSERLSDAGDRPLLAGLNREDLAFAKLYHHATTEMRRRLYEALVDAWAASV